jgi:hypothetical protein
MESQLPPVVGIPKPNVLSTPVAGFGAGIEKLQKSVTSVLTSTQAKLQLQRALLLPRDDQRRMAYLACIDNPTSRALLEGLPIKAVQLTTSEFSEALSSLFGIPSPVCANSVGKSIQNAAGSRQLRVDKYGNNIKTVSGAKGDHIRDFHDTAVGFFVDSAKAGGILTSGGHQRTCRDIFAHLIAADRIEADSEDGRRYQGIIPDIVTKANSILSAIEKHAGNPLFGTESLLDVKTLAPGAGYSEFSNATTDIGAVARRQARVTIDYHHSARQLDRKFNASAPGTIGPVELELNRYGVNGRVLGLVIGAFGECSSDVYYLRDLIAQGHATALTSKVNIPYDQALSVYTQKLNRLWGLLFARGWARVLLGRQKLIIRGDYNNGGARGGPTMNGYMHMDGDVHELRRPFLHHYRYQGGRRGE